MTLLEALKKTILCFHSRNLKFLLAGGFAYSFYCLPRATEDIDLLALSRDDADKIEEALRSEFASVYKNTLSFDFPLVEMIRYLLLDGDREFVLDVLFGINKEYSDEIFRRGKTFELDGVSLPVLSPEDLYIMKKISGRQKDLLDIGELEKAVPGLDRGYIEKWTILLKKV